MFDEATIPHVIIEEGKWGQVKITKHETYYLLSHNEIEWNTYHPKTKREYYEQYGGYDLAYGDVLITGFGFGQFATWLADKPTVKSVTVIEISKDVVDAFLANNTLPDNVRVIIADANMYKTDEHYDCIVLDHISNGKQADTLLQDLAQVAKNIPNHDIFWFWSLEYYYLTQLYGLTHFDLYANPVPFEPYDFYDKWQEFREKLSVKTLPQLEKRTLSIYIYYFFMRHTIQESGFPTDKFLR